MEYETDKQSGVWERLKQSPRTVSALIIILVVAAAIYAFSGNEQGTPAEESPATQPEDSGTPAAGNVAPVVTTPEAVTREALTEEREELPEATTTSEGYTEVAQAGDGMTHLARRAATRWLSENTPGYAVTNEHRIFIEDYIQKKIGSGWLEVSETHTIGYGLIEEAVEAAGELTPSQLNNLSQYTYVLT